MSGAGLNEAVRAGDPLAIFRAVRAAAVPALAVDNTPRRVPKSTLFDVKQVVCREYGITMAQIECADRRHAWAHPRQKAMYLCRELTDKSYPQIGRAFGGRDHTTCLFSYRKIAALRQSDAALSAELDYLRSQILTIAARRSDVARPCDLEAYEAMARAFGGVQ